MLELNTLPGMTKTSLIPRSANAKDISYSELIDKIIDTHYNICYNNKDNYILINLKYNCHFYYSM